MSRAAGRLCHDPWGQGSPGRVWELHQVPALVAAGYRVAHSTIAVIAPSFEAPDGMTLDELTADTAALIELLGEGPPWSSAPRWARGLPGTVR